VAAELERYAPLAQSHGLTAVRMGWGFHTNQTLATLARLRFATDSSAIPRPRYTWEVATRDWASTPAVPFHPSAGDYRIPGAPALDILEVPISTAPVAAPYDEGPVVRYINPAYRPALLAPVLWGWPSRHRHLVTVTHPYELVPAGEPHGLLAFEPAAFERNLRELERAADVAGVAVRYLTITQFADEQRRLGDAGTRDP
jgi:hypothetical protein